MTDILDHLREEVLLCDGAMGSRLQQADLDVEIDYLGQENCSEILNLSRPDIVREIQQGFVAAGADILLTNTFGGSEITLSEFDLQDRTFEINKIAAETSSDLIKQLIGVEVNSSSIAAIVEDISKKVREKNHEI